MRIFFVTGFSLTAGLLFRFVLIKGLIFFNDIRRTVAGESLLKHIGAGFKFFFPLVFLLTLISHVGLSEYKLNISINVIESLLFINGGYLVVKLLNVYEDIIYDRYNLKKGQYLKSRRIRTQVQFLRRIVSIMVTILVVGAVLFSFQPVREYGKTILTSAGVLGIIIGFAAQKSIGNLIAGVQIAFTQPIKIDDVVVLEGEWGVIEEINLTYVVINVWDKRRLILPITYFTEKPVENWTRNTSDLIGKVFIYTDYTIPIDAIRKKLNDIVYNSINWDGDVCRLLVTNTTENAVELRATVSAEDADKSWELRCEVREALVIFIQENYPECLPKTRAELYSENGQTSGLNYGNYLSDAGQELSNVAGN